MSDVPVHLCECGCRQETAWGRKFLHGHHLRANSPVRKERGRSVTGPLSDITIDGRSISRIGPREREELRHKAKTDLFWLSTEILGIPLCERVHRPLTEMLVQKDPSKPLAEQSSIKRRAYFLPRNSLKTTVSQANVVQWMLAFPNIRILILRGQGGLARQMLRELKMYLVNNQKLSWLFPEYCSSNIKKLGGRDELLCPARTKVLREPTVMIATPDSGKVGVHPDVLIIDDLADELNSITDDQREKTIRAYEMTLPILETYGYMTVVGTRYHPNDLYGILLRQADENPDKWRVMLRSAWTLHEGARSDSVNSADYDVWYPERLSFETLINLKSEMEAAGHGDIFSCQYLNIPAVSGVKQIFTRNLLLSHTIPAVQIPTHGEKFQVWDTAYGNTKRGGGDFTVCLTGIISGGRLFVVDAFRERTSISTLAGVIVEQAALHAPLNRVGIESAVGVKYIQPLIAQVAQAAKVPFKLDWLVPDRQRGGKLIRIGAVASLLTSNKLYFSASLPFLEVLYDELENMGKTKFDDMSDALGFLARYLTTGMEAPQTTWFPLAPASDKALPNDVDNSVSPDYGPNPCGYYLTG